MQLTCEKCGTRYVVPDAAVGATGRTVRCANCSYSWFQEGTESPAARMAVQPPPTTSEPPQRVRPLAPGSNLPVVVVTHSAPRWMRLLCVSLITLLFVLTPFAYRKSILGTHPELSFLFEPFGIYYTNGLALADVGVIKVERTKRPTYAFDCSVINEASGSRDLPQVRVDLYNSDGTMLGHSGDLVNSGKNMISGTTERCKTFIVEAPDNDIDHARVDLADPFDLSLRK